MYLVKNKLYLCILFLFDAIGNIVLFPLSLLRKRKLPFRIKQILVVRLDHIGDVVYSTAVPENLKKKFPQARVVFLAASSNRDLLEHNPFIDEVVYFDAPWFDRQRKRGFSLRKFAALVTKLRSYSFDIGFDLRGDLRHILLMCAAGVKFTIGYGVTGGGFLLSRCVSYDRRGHALKRNLDLLRSVDIEIVNENLRLYVSEGDKGAGVDFLHSHELKTEDPVVVMHPCAGVSAKNWRDTRFAELADILYKEFAARTVFIGSKNDFSNIEKIVHLSKSKPINAAGKTSLGSLFSLLKKAKLFVGVDSGPSHIAALSNVPTVVLYSGTNKAASWAPFTDKAVIIEKEIKCKECERRVCADNICMDLISVNDVLGAARKVWPGSAGEGTHKG